MGNVGLHRYSVLVAAGTLLLVAAGGLVTSNDAGLSVPDWPLSYGRLVPPLEGNIVYEFTHRATAAAVGALTLALAIWISRADRRRWMRRLAWIAVALVTAQAVMGGMEVKLLAPKPLSLVRATLAHLFFMLTVAMMLFLSPDWASAGIDVEDGRRP